MEEYRIIRDARVLTEHFIPRLIVHREGHLQAVRDALKPIVRSQRPRNVFLYGDTGTGKTCISRHVVEELESYSSSVSGSYVNCWMYPSRFKILFNILQDLGRAYSVHRKGTPTDELLDVLRRRTEGKQCIIILDEVDRVEDDRILYDLLRLENVGLILISNKENALHRVDSRIRSSLASADRVEFRRYTVPQVQDILRDRAEWGLYPGTVSEPQLRRIAELSAGDARVAIDGLRVVSEQAEGRDDDRIRDEHIETALRKSREAGQKQEMDNLNPHEKLLHAIISGMSRVAGSEIYPLYEKACREAGLEPAVDRTVRNGLVKAISQGRWREYESGR
jgi:orc1/cdc6 family replication initiation protein